MYSYILLLHYAETTSTFVGIYIVIRERIGLGFTAVSQVSAHVARFKGSM